MNVPETYALLGWDLKPNGSQLLCVCPFCDKHKMYVDPKKTTYYCQVCHTKGNPISVFGDMHEEVYRHGISIKKLKHLSKLRGLPVEAFKLDENLGWNLEKDQPTWVIRDNNDAPMGLRHGVMKKGKYQIRNFKDAKLGILGAEDLGKDPNATVYIVEGEWDRIAMKYLLKKTKKPGIVLAVPGAGNFKIEWGSWFEGRDVVLCYDYDFPDKRGKRPGYEGAKRASTFLKRRAKSLKFLSWEEMDEEGYDVHDLVADNVEDLEAAYEYIAENSLLTLWNPDGEDEDIGEDKEADEREQTALEPITAKELHQVFHKWLKLENCDLIDITMGCLWSIFLPGDPLWMFVVAPPSGSKTESLAPCSAWHRVFPVSTVSAKSLVSGFQGAGGGDPSLFAEMEGNNCAIIIKDLTPLLNARKEESEEVFGILRDAYDGSFKKIYGNGVVREYEALNFGVIAGVTPVIDVHQSVALGERFLKFRADKELEREDDRMRAFKAIDNADVSEAMRDELREACLRALARPFDEGKVPKADGENKDFKKFIVDMAEFCAKARAVAPYDRYTGIQEMSPVQEALPRLTKQFIKMAQGLALHYGIDTLDTKAIRRLIRRLAIHTPDIITVKIIRALSTAEGPISLGALFKRVRQVSRETMRDVLVRLERTGICEIIPSTDGKSLYVLQEKMMEIINRRSLFSDLPKNDPLYMRRRFKTLSKPSGIGSTKDTKSISLKRKSGKILLGRKIKSSKNTSSQTSSENSTESLFG